MNRWMGRRSSCNRPSASSGARPMRPFQSILPRSGGASPGRAGAPTLAATCSRAGAVRASAGQATPCSCTRRPASSARRGASAVPAAASLHARRPPCIARAFSVMRQGAAVVSAAALGRAGGGDGAAAAGSQADRSICPSACRCTLAAGWSMRRLPSATCRASRSSVVAVSCNCFTLASTLARRPGPSSNCRFCRLASSTCTASAAGSAAQRSWARAASRPRNCGFSAVAVYGARVARSGASTETASVAARSCAVPSALRRAAIGPSAPPWCSWACSCTGTGGGAGQRKSVSCSDRSASV